MAADLDRFALFQNSTRQLTTSRSNLKSEEPEKRGAAIAIEDRKKKKKPNPPDAPIAIQDRQGQAKRKSQIPDEAPDENVKKLGRQIIKMLARKAPSKTTKIMQKAIHAPPRIVDIGEPSLPPPFAPPSRDVFKGKGRRLADDDVASKGIIKLYDKKPTTKKKPGGVSGRARQLALMA